MIVGVSWLESLAQPLKSITNVSKDIFRYRNIIINLFGNEGQNLCITIYKNIQQLYMKAMSSTDVDLQ